MYTMLYLSVKSPIIFRKFCCFFFNFILRTIAAYKAVTISTIKIKEQQRICIINLTSLKSHSHFQEEETKIQNAKIK